MSNRGRPFRGRGDFHGFGGPMRGMPFPPPMRGPGPGFMPRLPRNNMDWRGRGGGRGYEPRPYLMNKFYNNNGRPGKRLSENELGITEYVGSLEGFNGIIKSRYADFQVNEVSVSGEVAQLTDLSVPKLDTPDDVEPNDDFDVLDKYNVEVLPLEMWDKINAIVLSRNASEKFEVDATKMSKEDRTKVYDAIQKVFGNRIFGTTVNTGDKKSIVFSKFPAKGRVDNREKWKWPAEYVHFIVHKENLDTMETAALIAEALRLSHIKPSFFGYSGTKDRRAKSSQWFSIRRVDPNRVLSACRRLRNVYVGNFEFKEYHLKLGYLKGNQFKIALRNVTATDEIILAAMESLRDNGFINYFGLQRFGARAEIPTFKVGQFLLQKKYQEAINLILEPRGPYDKALHVYKDTQDAKKALRFAPSNVFSNEIRLLFGLAHCAKNDLVTALEKVPRNTRLLYMHSYQSWVWNRCVSERIKRFGLKLAIGDLIPEDPKQVIEDSEDMLDEGNWDNADNEDDKDEDVDPEGKNKGTRDPKRNRGFEGKKILVYPKFEKKDLHIKQVTQEIIDSGTYTVFDLVLPLPGYNIEYPPNMKDYYESITKEDELNLDVKQRVKSYNLSGTYRKMLMKPENLSWKTIKYSNPYGDLILSDLDVLKKKEPIKDEPEGKFKALIVDITLHSSTYATMALREILKRDTSSESQAQQNDYHKEDENKSADETAQAESKPDSAESQTESKAEANVSQTESKAEANVSQPESKAEANIAQIESKSEVNKEQSVDETVQGEKRKIEDDDNESNDSKKARSSS